MADYGLAAQIGRGAGGNVMGGQQPDPTNRMMQMLQLQQLQQNMMLAREQEARQQQLFPLSLEEKRADIRSAGARADLVTTQGKSANVELEERQRQQRVGLGMINVMDMADQGKIDLTKPESIRGIADPEVRMAVRRQLTEIQEQNAKAREAGLKSDDVRRAQTFLFLDRTAPFISDPRSFAAARNKLLSVVPEAAEFVPDNYNPDNAARLADFVRTRKTSVQMIGNVPVMITEGSPTGQELSITPAGRNPAFGGLSPVQPAMPASSSFAAQAGAGTPADVGAMSSGIPGQRLPVAGEPGFIPVARGPVPGSEFVAGREAAKTAATKQEALPKVQASYTSAVDAIDKQLRAIQDLRSRPFGTMMSTGSVMGRAPNIAPFDITGAAGAQALIDTIKAGGTLQALTELRRNSPTGGALGNTSDRDIQLLTDSVGALAQTQSTTDFMKQISTLENDLKLTKQRLTQAYQSEYGAPPKVEGGPLSKAKDGVDTSNPLLR